MAEIQLRGGSVDGLRLHYVVEGRGPAVILVHGLGGFAETWRHNVGALASRATVYSLDLPGFGDSAKPPARAAYLATLRDVRVDFETHAQDYCRALGTLDLPVLLIHGRQDRIVSPEHCAQVAETLVRARVRWVDDCGHFPQIEHVEAVNGWLVDFLVGRPAPR